MDFFVCSASSCHNPWSEANENTDTVKVNPQLEMMEYEKENESPNMCERGYGGTVKATKEFDPAKIAAADKATEQICLRLRASRERAEREAAEEAQRLAAELAADEAKEDAKIERQMQREAEQARVAAQEASEWQRQEERLAAMRAQQLKDQAEREEQDLLREQAEQQANHALEMEQLNQQAEQQARDASKVHNFLSQHGFAGVNTKRTRMLKSKYPLHTAVKLADRDTLTLLLASGANASLKNSGGDTPKQLARKLNKGGSHDAVYEALP